MSTFNSITLKGFDHVSCRCVNVQCSMCEKSVDSGIQFLSLFGVRLSKSYLLLMHFVALFNVCQRNFLSKAKFFVSL
jgi:hypothetical protein